MKGILLAMICALLAAESANAADHHVKTRHASKSVAKKDCHRSDKALKSKLQFYFSEYRALETELGV